MRDGRLEVKSVVRGCTPKQLTDGVSIVRSLVQMLESGDVCEEAGRRAVGE